MCESVTEISARSCSGNSHWDAPFELVPKGPSSDCGESNAASYDIVLFVPSPSILTVSVVLEKMRYGPSFRDSHFEFKSVSSRSMAFASNRGRSA